MLYVFWQPSIRTFSSGRNSVCIALISLGLMTTVHPAAIAGATLTGMETGARIPRREDAHHAHQLDDDLGRTDGSWQVQVLQNFFEVQKNIRGEVVRVLRAIVCSTLFQNCRTNELIHSPDPAPW